MAATAAQLPLSKSAILPNFRQRGITTTSFPSPLPSHKIHKKCKFLKLNERPSKSTVDVQRKVDSLNEDLLHLFYNQRINRTAFDDYVRFRDPITKYDTIAGYMLNIALLKMFFLPHCLLHWSKQSGPYEITLRWTVLMTFVLLPWKPQLAFTGISVVGINPETGKFNSHVDTWDSIKDNDYFSLEGAWDVFRQLRMYKTPDLDTPKYQILKRAADYEVRKYPKFVVVEAQGDRLSGSASFDSVVTCIFEKNSKAEIIPTTTPVFTETNNVEEPNAAIQIIFSHHKDLDRNDSLRDLNQDTAVSLQEVDGGIAAALTFSGLPTVDIIRTKETELRDSLIRDGLKPRKGCVFVPYNDPGRRWKLIMRNEVLIWLEDFRLD